VKSTLNNNSRLVTKKAWETTLELTWAPNKTSREIPISETLEKIPISSLKTM
jgi:hypothetical protein